VPLFGKEELKHLIARDLVRPTFTFGLYGFFIAQRERSRPVVVPESSRSALGRSLSVILVFDRPEQSVVGKPRSLSLAIGLELGLTPPTGTP
jgi:hypothetical protein